MSISHKYTMTEEYALIIHKMAESDASTMKNHIAMYVEDGKFDKAQELVKKLRLLQDIFAAFNIEAKHTIAEFSGKPLETEHNVYPRR